MDKIDSSRRELVVDLENGDTTSDEDEIKEHSLRQLPPVAAQNESATISKNSFSSGEGVKLIKEEEEDVRAEAVMDQKKTKRGSKKPPKPPRPPRGPTFNEADIKLVREISQLSRLRRARYERIKALQKMRADRASSSKSNVFAMIITILFICVIVFQGILGSHV